MERVNQYFKDRTENFDNYFSCMEDEYNLFHVYNWIQLFVSMYNDTTSNKNDFIIQLQEEVNIIKLTEANCESNDSI
jgi:calcineurin-like phosphoesterase